MPDARVLRFPSATGAIGAQDHGPFTRELSPDELAGCCFFSDDDRGRIATRRGDASRLGCAVQLGTVRYLARFLQDPADVPASVRLGDPRARRPRRHDPRGLRRRRGALGAPGRDPPRLRLPPVRRPGVEDEQRRSDRPPQPRPARDDRPLAP